MCVLFSGCCLQSLSRWISAATWLSSSCYHTRSLRRGLRFYRNTTPIHPVFISHVYFLKQISSFSIHPTLLSIVKGEEKKWWEIPKHHCWGETDQSHFSFALIAFTVKLHSMIIKYSLTISNITRVTTFWCFWVLRIGVMCTNMPIKCGTYSLQCNLINKSSSGVL